MLAYVVFRESEVRASRTAAETKVVTTIPGRQAVTAVSELDRLFLPVALQRHPPKQQGQHEQIAR